LQEIFSIGGAARQTPRCPHQHVKVRFDIACEALREFGVHREPPRRFVGCVGCRSQTRGHEREADPWKSVVISP
jgi:hypothetical protein